MAAEIAMQAEPTKRTEDAVDDRARLLWDLPVKEQRVTLAGISTAVLAGGDGAPVVLLHEPGSFAAHWARVIPTLAQTHRILAPDLPGHGASDTGEGKLEGGTFLAWLAELVDRCCDSPPTLVGHLGSGALAARFAVEHADRLRALVLVDSFGLAQFRPTPGFALALFRYVARPTPRTYGGLMERCIADFAAVREDMGEHWQPFVAYTLDQARSAGGKTALRVLMRELSVPAIPPQQLERISIPTTLVWGRHDPVNRLRVAEAASARYCWPLHVIDDAGDDPPLEQPGSFVQALYAALETSAAE